jgi:hypothetical protein
MERPMKKAALLVAVTCLWIPFTLLVAWSCACLWSWYLAPQYGAGPSIMSWVGVSAIVGVTVGRLLATVKRVDGAGEMSKVLAVEAGLCLGTLLALGCAWVLRALVWGAP